MLRAQQEADRHDRRVADDQGIVSDGRQHLATITPLHGGGGPDVDDLIARFLARYSNARTRRQYSTVIPTLLDGRPLDALTPERIIAWCRPARPLSNNSIKGRISLARTFLHWCARQGHFDPVVVDEATGQDSPLRTIKRTYGKVQSKYPGRWLSAAECKSLIDACDRATNKGLRDALVIRLGLSGLRANEIGTLTWRARVAGHPDTLQWFGKGSKPRRVVPGAILWADWDEMNRRATAGLGVTPDRDMAVICSAPRGRPDTSGKMAGCGEMNWGQPYAFPTQSVYTIVHDCAMRAGLGYVVPHDLRRTAAGLLHLSRDTNGKHDFDLTDIQQVLGHSDPTTTMKSYIDPIDNDVLEAASSVLDF